MLKKCNEYMNQCDMLNMSNDSQRENSNVEQTLVANPT